MRLSEVILNRLLTEGRVDDAKKKYGSGYQKGSEEPGTIGLPDEVISQLSSGDPSGNNKYLMWMARETHEGMMAASSFSDIERKTFKYSSGRSPEDIIQYVQGFHKSRQRLQKKDIYGYDEAEEVRDAVNAIGLSKREKFKKQKYEGTDNLYEDERFVLLHIMSKSSSCHYGRGTRWCITMSNQDYFEDYTRKGYLFYFLIDKKGSSYGDNNKTAFAINPRDGDTEIYDEDDNEISLSDLVQNNETTVAGDNEDFKEWPKGFAAKMSEIANEDSDDRETPSITEGAETYLSENESEWHQNHNHVYWDIGDNVGDAEEHVSINAVMYITLKIDDATGIIETSKEEKYAASPAIWNNENLASEDSLKSMFEWALIDTYDAIDDSDWETDSDDIEFEEGSHTIIRIRGYQTGYAQTAQGAENFLGELSYSDSLQDEYVEGCIEELIKKGILRPVGSQEDDPYEFLSDVSFDTLNVQFIDGGVRRRSRSSEDAAKDLSVVAQAPAIRVITDKEVDTDELSELLKKEIYDLATLHGQGSLKQLMLPGVGANNQSSLRVNVSKAKGYGKYEKIILSDKESANQYLFTCGIVLTSDEPSTQNANKSLAVGLDVLYETDRIKEVAKAAFEATTDQWADESSIKNSKALSAYLNSRFTKASLKKNPDMVRELGLDAEDYRNRNHYGSSFGISVYSYGEDIKITGFDVGNPDYLDIKFKGPQGIPVKVIKQYDFGNHAKIVFDKAFEEIGMTVKEWSDFIKKLLIKGIIKPK